MPRIIVAEDDEIVAEIVRDTLIQAGHAVGVVQDGAATLDVIRAKRPDMVILDCSLPSMTGVQIVRQMRIDYDLWEIPALMLTARVSASDEDLAMYAGADEYMRKPFDPKKLLATVDVLLTEAHDRKALEKRPAGARAI